MKYLIVAISMVTLTRARPEYGSHYLYHGPPAPIGHDGRVVDTPEVAQAKKAHLAAYAAAASKASYSTAYADDEDHYGYSNPTRYSGSLYHAGNAYRGPPAPLDHEGRVVDTPEVAEAKAAHFAAYNEAASKAAHGPSSEYEEEFYGEDSFQEPRRAYHGPQAPLAHDGRVVETSEVAQARAAHLAAFANAPHAASYYSHY